MIGLLSAGAAVWGCGSEACAKDLKGLAQAAVSEDAAVSGAAIASLRAEGPAGLQALEYKCLRPGEQYKKWIVISRKFLF